MSNTIFQLAQENEFVELADWLVAVGQAPEQHCLHTWSGESPSALQKQMSGYWQDGELCYILARQDGRLVGAMGSEYDIALERAWLRGPHAIQQEWEPLATQLFNELRAALPTCIHRMDAYLNGENQRGQQFYLQQGFEKDEHLNYDFWLEPGDRIKLSEKSCIRLEKQHHPSFVRLYENIFPAAYYSAERVIQMIGQSHQVMVVAPAGEVSGFVITCIEEGASSGEVQFLGVCEQYRHQGYGRHLLLSAVNWLFDDQGVTRVCLNVGEDRVQARALYESVGFKLKFTGIAFKKIL